MRRKNLRIKIASVKKQYVDAYSKGQSELAMNLCDYMMRLRWELHTLTI